jgi:hypothetical protein
MTIAGCEEQIIRIKGASFQPELNEALEAQFRERVKIAVQTTVEGALEAELAEDLADRVDEKPRRSGFFRRVMDIPSMGGLQSCACRSCAGVIKSANGLFCSATRVA